MGRHDRGEPGFDHGLVWQDVFFQDLDQRSVVLRDCNVRIRFGVAVTRKVLRDCPYSTLRKAAHEARA